MRYECSTTQDVLYVRLAPRRHDRSVPMLSMDARVRFTLRLPDGRWRCWGWIITTEAFFIFPRVTQKNPHSDRIWTPERYRPMTWVNRTPQQCRDPPLRPDMDPREVSSHDLGESYAAEV